jgi:hypothetical protein
LRTAATSAGVSGSAGYFLPLFGATGLLVITQRLRYRIAKNFLYSTAPVVGSAGTGQQKPYYFSGNGANFEYLRPGTCIRSTGAYTVDFDAVATWRPICCPRGSLRRRNTTNYHRLPAVPGECPDRDRSV